MAGKAAYNKAAEFMGSKPLSKSAGASKIAGLAAGGALIGTGLGYISGRAGASKNTRERLKKRSLNGRDY